MTIQDIQNRTDLVLVTDSQYIEAIKARFGFNKNLEDFDGFFVKIEDGDYSEVYGFAGTVPYLYKELTNIDDILN